MALYDALSLRKCCALASKCRREILCRAASETPVAEDPLLRPLQTSPPAGQHGRHIGLVPIHSRGRCPHSRPVSQVRKPAIVSHNVTAPCAAATGRSGYTATEETENPVALQQ
jgi:hypothetical protein